MIQAIIYAIIWVVKHVPEEILTLADSLFAYRSPAPSLMLKENLASTLREEIVCGRLQPGEMIVEGK